MPRDLSIFIHNLHIKYFDSSVIFFPAEITLIDVHLGFVKPSIYEMLTNRPDQSHVFNGYQLVAIFCESWNFSFFRVLQCFKLNHMNNFVVWKVGAINLTAYKDNCHGIIAKIQLKASREQYRPYKFKSSKGSPHVHSWTRWENPSDLN